jgi:hypothetical protein
LKDPQQQGGRVAFTVLSGQDQANLTVGRIKQLEAELFQAMLEQKELQNIASMVEGVDVSKAMVENQKTIETIHVRLRTLIPDHNWIDAEATLPEDHQDMTDEAREPEPGEEGNPDSSD